MSFRSLVATLPLYAVIFAFGVSRWLAVVVVAGLLLGVLNLLSLTRKIRRSE